MKTWTNQWMNLAEFQSGSRRQSKAVEGSRPPSASAFWPECRSRPDELQAPPTVSLSTDFWIQCYTRLCTKFLLTDVQQISGGSLKYWNLVSTLIQTPEIQILQNSEKNVILRSQEMERIWENHCEPEDVLWQVLKCESRDVKASCWHHWVITST